MLYTAGNSLTISINTSQLICQSKPSSLFGGIFKFTLTARSLSEMVFWQVADEKKCENTPSVGHILNCLSENKTPISFPFRQKIPRSH